jgi:CHAT domain-containing protein
VNINSAISAPNGGLTISANTSGNGNLNTPGIGVITDSAPISVAAFTLASGFWNQVGTNNQPLPAFAAANFSITGGTFLRAAGGDGSSGSPYQITDVFGLQGIGSSGMPGYDYVLANPTKTIDASGTANWNGGAGFAPIGSQSTPFTGGFDGRGQTISGLTIDLPAGGSVGLFGYTKGATITGVGLVNGAITGQNSVGGLVGYMDGGPNGSIMSNCSNTGAVTGLAGSAWSNVGGLVGDVAGDSGIVSISYCTNAGPVTGSGGTWLGVGGVVGNVDGNLGKVSIGYCSNSGSVSGAGSSYFTVGGIAGFVQDDSGSATVNKCSNTGPVSGANGQWFCVGGVAGYVTGGAPNAVISYSSNSGQVSGAGGMQYVGGVVGYMDGSGANSGVSMNNCINTGTVIGAGGSWIAVGGVVGWIAGDSGSAGISYSTNSGGVYGASALDFTVGGVVGEADGKGGTVAIDNSANSGVVNGADSAWFCVGGVAGIAAGDAGNVSITNSNNSGALSGSSGEQFIGGVVGWANASSGTVTVDNCTNTGTVNATLGDYINAGGIAGNAFAGAGGVVTISNSNNSGAVTGGNGRVLFIGGLAGQFLADLQGSVNIINSSNSGAISGFNGGFVIGGLAGDIFGDPGGITINNSYSTGVLTALFGSESSNVGDLSGLANAFAGAVTAGDGLNAGTASEPSAKESDVGEFRAAAGMLLQRASLPQAQAAIEMMRTCELEEYFKDGSIAQAQAHKTNLRDIPKTTAVAYSLVLPDRVELILGFNSGLKRFTIPVDAGTLTRDINRLRTSLERRTRWDFSEESQKIYNLIVKPMEAELAAHGSHTLVFMPDGVLRTIPFAALSDGSRFLIEKYSVALSPGLNLTDSRPIPQHDPRLLSAGLTEAVQGFAPLGNVKDELDGIGGLYKGDRLVNSDFSLRSVREGLESNPPSIVHIATHGKFGPTAADTFLVAWDELIDMNQVGQLMKASELRKTPVGLLCLSACETAVGDDKAALGLAGIAVKSGARSAMATLWSVSDQAASNLVLEFYNQLRNSGVSKAEALRAAQLKLLEDPRYRHPFYWSPFLLIGNWQ